MEALDAETWTLPFFLSHGTGPFLPILPTIVLAVVRAVAGRLNRETKCGQRVELFRDVR
jgi:hypothetical protein